jgi:hypothetical protein
MTAIALGRAKNLEPITRVVTQEPLSHLAARNIAGTND